MRIKTTIEKTKKEILNGRTYTTPGATEEARREPFYCSRLTVSNCKVCSLCNYGRDCHNNEIDPYVEMPTGWIEPINIPVNYPWK